MKRFYMVGVVSVRVHLYVKPAGLVKPAPGEPAMADKPAEPGNERASAGTPFAWRDA